jgi:hypothetical protein
MGFLNVIILERLESGRKVCGRVPRDPIGKQCHIIVYFVLSLSMINKNIIGFVISCI